MTGDAPLEQVRFLARADSRVNALSALADADSATQRELRDDLDASRTTVSRALQSLADQGWVVESDGTYRLTPTGCVVAEEFTDLLSTVKSVDELAAFLRWFPSDVDAPDFHEASDVDVTTPTDADPYAPARSQTEILRDADRLRALLPATDRESTETLVEQVTERGLEVASVVSPAVEATLESEDFAPLVRDLLETDRATIHVAPEPVPFYLGLAADGTVQVGVADDEGFPRALLQTTDDEVREWAERLYEEYRAAARHKPVEAL
jgi:predicted transcriptional regulator